MRLPSISYVHPLILGFGLLAGLGLLRIRRCPRKGLLITGIFGMVLMSWPPVDWLLSRPLERPYQTGSLSQSPAPEAIVVFGSSVNPPSEETPYPVPDYDTFLRCEHAAWLHNRWPSLPVLASGGGGRWPRPPVAVAMRTLLGRAGVPLNLIWTEERSVSTYQNALFASQALRKQAITKVALVVDASSMTRAAACLRKQGIQVLPAPCDFRVFGRPYLDEFIPNWKALRRNERTLHEMVGLAWYWALGRI
jgi:uncharacterized SAM-binding protein YcdF (DUF218 family)